jgi:ribosome-associated translation inhibitor RaiA
MHVDVQSRGFELTDALRDYAIRRLAYGLGQCAPHVVRVAVQLFDINGPRGGADKRCRIRVKLDIPLEVVLEDTQPNLYVAIDRVAGRAGRTVARNLRRQRQVRHAAMLGDEADELPAMP